MIKISVKAINSFDPWDPWEPTPGLVAQALPVKPLPGYETI